MRYRPGKPEEKLYAEQLGAAALERQRALERSRCPICWAPNGRRHSRLCPNITEQGEPMAASQQEALF